MNTMTMNRDECEAEWENMTGLEQSTVAVLGSWFSGRGHPKQPKYDTYSIADLEKQLREAYKSTTQAHQRVMERSTTDNWPGIKKMDMAWLGRVLKALAKKRGMGINACAKKYNINMSLVKL